MVTIAVDWSGAKRPTRKLALAEVVDGELRPVRTPTSREEVVEELIRICHQSPDTVIGLDFAFSLPAWFLAERGLTSVVDLWRLVEREGEGWLRDCPDPFWGRPGRSRPLHARQLRHTEEALGSVGGISIKSVFQIGGAGTVGTGSLRGMPLLLTLRAAGISVWPFDPPLKPFVVEIYPRLLTGVVIKRSAQARSDFLQQHWNHLPQGVRDSAVQSEDRFDAAISALVMDRSRHEFALLPTLADPLQALEGAIWSPRSKERPTP